MHEGSHHCIQYAVIRTYQSARDRDFEFDLDGEAMIFLSRCPRKCEADRAVAQALER
jgi:hypothetical protein